MPSLILFWSYLKLFRKKEILPAIRKFCFDLFFPLFKEKRISVSTFSISVFKKHYWYNLTEIQTNNYQIFLFNKNNISLKI